MTHWQTRLWWSSLWDAGPTTGGRDPEPTSTTQQELNFSNDDSFYQSKRYIVWKAMVYDIYLGLTSMEQKNNKVTFKTFEAKVPSYLQQKNDNAMSMSKRRTHEWYWEVTYVRDWIMSLCLLWWVVVTSVYVEVWESVWVFRIIFQLSHSNSTNDNQPFASVYSTLNGYCAVTDLIMKKTLLCRKKINYILSIYRISTTFVTILWFHDI